jgi:glycosyltransferase 2 family protein
VDHAIVSFYRDSPRSVFYSLGFHFLGWVAGVVEVFLILHFLKIPVSLSTAWAIEALWVLLRSGAFMIPASIGASEGILLFICGGFGIGAVPGLALALIRRARELTWVGLGLMEFARER